MGLETFMLKGARVQKFLVALFYLVLGVCSGLYIVCVTVKSFEFLCTLALLHPWIQARPKHSDSSPIFGPCRPRVAVLRARWGRNRSPPGEGPCWATQGRFCANRCGGAVLVSFSLPNPAS